MKKLTLTVQDRLMIDGLLPREGNKITMILTESIIAKTQLTPEEISEFELKSEENGFIKWNPQKAHDVEFELTPEQVMILKDSIKKLDEENKITRDFLTLVLKIEKL